VPGSGAYQAGSGGVRFGAQAIPTLLVLRDGRVAARQTGAAPLAALRAWVDSALATAAP
jgi:thioredoxin 2